MIKSFGLAWINNKDDISNMTLRLELFIGLPLEKEYTHFTAFWVDPADEFEEWYIDWFDKNIVWLYFDSAYSWAGLGYTYDWADNGQEYGLSELIIFPDSDVMLEFTLTNDKFIE